jgi:putative Ca2+/H+ antiporter (TMEM165/GDT1 family)
MLQKEVNKKYLGRVLAYNDMIFMLSNTLTTFFIGFMATQFDISIVTFILGCMFFIVALYYKYLYKKD